MPYSSRLQRRATHKTRRFSGSSPSGARNKAKHGQYIDPARFVQVATAAEAEDYIPTHSFTDMPLHELLQTNLRSSGYTQPSPIQDQTIPAALEGRDIIGIASTGTGKTAAFALPILQKLLTDRTAAALIIAPTRELAGQIEDSFRMLGKGTGLWSVLLIGGANMMPQLRDLKRRPRVVIGTPGRIKDHLERRTLDLSEFNVVVLDEVDRMLDMGFVADVTEILSHANDTRQSLFFSATIEPKVHQLITRFTVDPITVTIKASSSSENVHQDVVRYDHPSEKISLLHEVLTAEGVNKVIIFDETKHSVDRLSKELFSRGFSVDAIHGGKSQGARTRALNKFKKNEINVLVATDVAARGIDVADISHVINYSLPKAYDDYVHRVGRAGRAGQIGYALTFIADSSNSNR